MSSRELFKKLSAVLAFLVICSFIWLNLINQSDHNKEFVFQQYSREKSESNLDDEVPSYNIRNTYIEQIKDSAHGRYHQRRALINEYCKAHADDEELTTVNTDPKWMKDLWFDYENHLIFCQISKVSSSTWVSHLLSLHGQQALSYNNALQKEGFSQGEWRPETRRRMFYLRNETLEDAANDLFSFVFVREPFSRIVSSYHNKMARDWSKPIQELRWMRNEILNRYRKGPRKKKAAPTPTEFVNYIVDTAKEKGPYNLDNHIKPLWTACPFCMIGFDAVALLEESDDEIEYIAKALNLADKLKLTKRANSRVKDAENELARKDSFFANVPLESIHKLFEYCRRDYEMFGYPLPTRYLSQ